MKNRFRVPGLSRRKPRNKFRSMIAQLPNLLKLVMRLFTDPRVSMWDRALFAGVIAYVLTPMDLLPDWLGMIGLTDDLYLVSLALGRLLHRAGPDVLLEYWEGPPKALGYIMESVDQIGARLPAPIRRILQGTVFAR